RFGGSDPFFGAGRGALVNEQVKVADVARLGGGQKRGGGCALYLQHALRIRGRVGDLAADQGHHGLDAGDRAPVVVVGVLERRGRVDGDRQAVPALAHGEAVGLIDGGLRWRGLILLRVARGGDE